MIVVLVLVIITISLLSLLLGRRVVEYGTQVIVQSGQTRRLRTGPSVLWYLKFFDKLTTVDISERTCDLTIGGCPIKDAPPASIELTIVYSISNALLLPPMDRFVPLVKAFAETAARRTSLDYTVAQLRQNDVMTAAVANRITQPCAENGFVIHEVLLRRVSGLSAKEAVMGVEGAGAKKLGKEGLYLRYLKSLQLLADSPAAKIIVPVGLAENTEAVADLLQLNE